MKKVLVIVLLLLSLVACSSKEISYEKIEYNQTELNYSEVDMSVYPNMTVTNHAFKKVRFGEANKLYASSDNQGGTGVVYYGYSDCSFCRQAVSVMNEVAMNMGVTIYYVDVFSEYPEKDADYEKLVELVKDFLVKEDGEPVFYVPQVFVVKDGVIVGDHLSLTDDYVSGNLTDSQKIELQNIYINIFKKLK